MKYIGLVALVLSLGVASPSPVFCSGNLNQPSALDGSSWTLWAMGDGDNLRKVSQTPPRDPGVPPHGAIWRPSMLEGSIGCRAYHVGYQLGDYDDDGFLIGVVGHLLIPPVECPTRDLFEREVEYRDTLNNAQSGTLTHYGQRLAIEAEGGRLLIFRRDLDW